ncbi:nuclease PIN [Corallococcus sp. H22C18031201]|uniref:FHA domain-containing protein n=1 Tax=Citreicoccus inhibens TaxID=2849499 RepID=UPI000E769B81|nr:FHA domain-containing protein [Citreicoccus inhibens]MBU8898275.1 FHA domain-containing protein [Citreicoccus inhibens]RJS27546.1 nuclease PIN [Corallococcus sp. H22C18031201]
MAPPNPKRPPRPPRPPGKQAAPDDSVDLPFDDDEVAPLQADDPRPQRVPQFPAGPRKGRRRKGGDRTGSDRELSPRLDWHKEYSDPGHPPAFLYVEKGPGAGQLVPVQQGAMTLGRSSSSDLRLQHASISRRHAQLTRKGNHCVLRDLGSQNGTFVNRVRITGEVELNSGDELSLGNAVLRLRGPGGTPAAGLPAVHPPEPPPPEPPRRRRASSLAVALLAAAGGSAVAALLTFAAVRATETQPSVIPAAPPSEATAPPPEPPRPGIHLTATEVDPSSDDTPEEAPTETRSAAQVARAGGRGSAAAQREAQESRAGGRGPGSSAAPREPQEPRVRTRAATAAAERGGAQQVVEVTPARGGASALEADVRARYESGNVAAARERAQSAKLTALAALLTRYEAAEADARKALAKRDLPHAIASLTTALSLDFELSHGWSKQGPVLRKQLAGLHTLVGREAAQGGRQDEAREHYERALQYDSEDREARDGLTRLSGAESRAPAAPR